MTTNDAATKPIHNMEEWRKAMFPNDPSRHSPDDDANLSPAELGSKLAARAVESLSKKSAKPTQKDTP